MGIMPIILVLGTTLYNPKTYNLVHK
jgi:hypothetical protein